MPKQIMKESWNAKKLGTFGAILGLKLAFCASLLSVQAMAAPHRGQGGVFLGNWEGRGQAVQNPDSPSAKTRTCSDIQLNMDESATKLSLISGSYTCQDMHADYGTADFEIQNGTLWYQGQQIGTITDRELTLSVADPSDGSTFSLTLVPQYTSEGPVLSYLEEWSETSSGKILFRVSGKLLQN